MHILFSVILFIICYTDKSDLETEHSAADTSERTDLRTTAQWWMTKITTGCGERPDRGEKRVGND